MFLKLQYHILCWSDSKHSLHSALPQRYLRGAYRSPMLKRQIPKLVHVQSGIAREGCRCWSSLLSTCPAPVHANLELLCIKKQGLDYAQSEATAGERLCLWWHPKGPRPVSPLKIPFGKFKWLHRHVGNPDLVACPWFTAADCDWNVACCGQHLQHFLHEGNHLWGIAGSAQTWSGFWEWWVFQMR